MVQIKKIEKAKAKKLLEKTILTQKEIATHLRITEKTVTKWKREFEKEKANEKEISINVLDKLLKINTELIEIKTLLKQLLK